MPEKCYFSGISAMCYCPGPGFFDPLNTCKCDLCQRIINFRSWDADKVKKTVEQMVELGYDAKVQVLCDKCAKIIKSEIESGIEDNNRKIKKRRFSKSGNIRNFLFYFRINDSEPYHRTIVHQDNESSFELLLKFLTEKDPSNLKILLASGSMLELYIDNSEGESTYRYQLEENIIKEKLKTIESMTGLKIDESLKSQLYD